MRHVRQLLKISHAADRDVVLAAARQHPALADLAGDYLASNISKISFSGPRRHRDFTRLKIQQAAGRGYADLIRGQARPQGRAAPVAGLNL